MRRRSISLSVLILAILFVPVLTGLQTRAAGEPARNVILMIGDGMGSFQRQAAAQLAGRALEMDQMPVAGAIANPAANWRVTDSAAAATAMATGRKTAIGALSVAPDGTRLETILERARKKGLVTGLIATSSITHATPAAFAAHQVWRDCEAAIASQLLEARVDLMLGGGHGFFIPGSNPGSLRRDRRDLIQEFMSRGYCFAEDQGGLEALNALPALGLFAREEMAPALDRDPARQPSVAEMTRKALGLLSAAGHGFFLMVEGSQIDWACHANDPGWAVAEVLAFDQAVSVARQFATVHPGTLVIVVADHETGGMGPGPDYFVNADALRGQKASGKAIAAMAAGQRERELIAGLLKQYAGVSDLSPAEQALLTQASELEPAINRIMSARAGITWSTGSHTGKNVPLTAEGAQSGLFAGYYDNTEIYRKIVTAFGWE